MLNLFLYDNGVRRLPDPNIYYRTQKIQTEFAFNPLAFVNVAPFEAISSEP